LLDVVRAPPIMLLFSNQLITFAACLTSWYCFTWQIIMGIVSLCCLYPVKVIVASFYFEHSSMLRLKVTPARYDRWSSGY
jgi:hypothetical protein